MKAEIVFEKEKGGVKVTFFDTLKPDDVTETIQNIISNPEFSPNMSGLYDLTYANLSEIDSEMVEAISVQLVELLNGKIDGVKVAIVSEHAINHGTMRLFKEVYPDKHITMEVFDSLEQAESWLYNNKSMEYN